MKNNEKVHIDEYYLQETNGWLRELDFFISELSFLKTRLAHIVDSANDKTLVAKAEKFQSDFLHHDDQIKKIKSKVLSHETELQKKQSKNKLSSENTFEEKQNHMRNHVASIELHFIEIKNSFNSYALNSITSLS